MSRPAAAVDPIDLSTIWHSLQSYCREMRHIIERTAQNQLMAELRDISVGIWDREARTVAIPAGLPVQFLGGKYTIRYILDQFGDDIHPGDVFLTNDPYHGFSCHLPDWAFIRPIFWRDELLFFTLARGNQYDTGGSFPGGYFPNAYDIIAEGLNIPPIKVIERGNERSDVLGLIWNNVRWPAGVRVDNYALIAATSVCEKRIHGMLAKYGKDVAQNCIEEMMRRTEAAVRDEIRKIPDGTYHAEAASDDDGTVLDEPVWVRLSLTVAGDELALDFSRSDSQRKGFVNSIYASVYSQALATVFLFLGPDLADYHNEGSMRPVTLIAPSGTVTNARWPATVGAAPVSVGTQVMETVAVAMSQALGERAVAPWARRYGHFMFGPNPRTGGNYVQTTFDCDGGAGAVHGYDGFEGVASITTLGEVSRGNIEELEIRVPWRLLRYEFAQDSAGAGRWRGARGMHWEMLNEGGDAKMATGNSDGERTFPAGVGGGWPSPPNRCFIVHGGERRLAKSHRLHEVPHGAVVVKQTGGGAGVGDPTERDPGLVRWDVLNRAVSLEAAREIYRVEIDPATYAIVALLPPRKDPSGAAGGSGRGAAQA